MVRRTEIERRITEKEALLAAILRVVAAHGDGTPMAVKEFAHLGERRTVNRALAWLCECNRLVRVGRGLYARPIATRLGKAPPPLDHAVRVAAQDRGERIAIHGAASAYHLGLVRRAPEKPVYLTTGPSRQMTIGAQTVSLRHAPDWQIDIPIGRAGNVIRALAWMGPEKAEEALGALEKRLPAVAADELAKSNTNLPAWLAAAIDRLVEALCARYGLAKAQNA